MNKKILFLFFLSVIALPLVANAAKTPKEMADAIATLAQNIGVAIVVIGWVITGILYLTSTGSPEKIVTARKALIATVVGTVLVIIAKGGYETIKGLLKDVI